MFYERDLKTGDPVVLQRVDPVVLQRVDPVVFYQRDPQSGVPFSRSFCV